MKKFGDDPRHKLTKLLHDTLAHRVIPSVNGQGDRPNQDKERQTVLICRDWQGELSGGRSGSSGPLHWVVIRLCEWGTSCTRWAKVTRSRGKCQRSQLPFCHLNLLMGSGTSSHVMNVFFSSHQYVPKLGHKNVNDVTIPQNTENMYLLVSFEWEVTGSVFPWIFDVRSD